MGVRGLISVPMLSQQVPHWLSISPTLFIQQTLRAEWQFSSYWIKLFNQKLKFSLCLFPIIPHPSLILLYEAEGYIQWCAKWTWYYEITVLAPGTQEFISTLFYYINLHPCEVFITLPIWDSLVYLSWWMKNLRFAAKFIQLWLLHS